MNIEIRTPEAYRSLMSDLASDISCGKLNEQGDIPSITEIVKNWPLQNDDWIEREMHCAHCHQEFKLFVETYHGYGGYWKPVAR